MAEVTPKRFIPWMTWISELTSSAAESCGTMVSMAMKVKV
jgi:hypothetical protein